MKKILKQDGYFERVVSLYKSNSILRNSGEMGGMRGIGGMGGMGGIGGMKFDFFYMAGTKHRSHRSD